MRSGTRRLASVLVGGLVLAAASSPPGAGAAGAEVFPAAVVGRSITYEGAIRDQPDLHRLGIGEAGHWFAQFGASAPVRERPTGEREVDALPDWVAPLNHWAVEWCSGTPPHPGCPTFSTRTFSQDGPARSMGGYSRWNRLVLPGGHRGLSGAVVDPHTAGSQNNTVNRIQLRGDVPDTFWFHVVTDTTARRHRPADLVRARGNVGEVDTDQTQVEADRWPETAELSFNGSADVYSWRFDGFESGDYIKLRLRAPEGSGGGSVAGFLFGETFDPAAVPSAPRRVVAMPEDGAAGVTWKAPLDDGGSPITRYTAVARPGRARCTTDGATACTISGLESGRTYRVAVRARNGTGAGSTSTPPALVRPF